MSNNTNGNAAKPVVKKEKPGMKKSEIIVVIAVVIIFALLLCLYGVWVTKKANEAPAVQDSKAEEQLKLLIDKLDKANYMTKDDLEKALNEALANYKDTSGEQRIITIVRDPESGELTEEEIRDIVEKALAGKLDDTNVQVIVDKVDGKLTDEEITELVKAALEKLPQTGVSQETLESTIKSILAEQTEDIINSGKIAEAVEEALKKSDYAFTQEEIEAIVKEVIAKTSK